MRLETGPFKPATDDWTGTFIRGDDSLHLSMVLESVVNSIRNGEQPTHLYLMILEGYAEVLRECNEKSGTL